MPNRASRCRQRDIERALRAAKNVGIPIANVSISKEGLISINAAPPPNADIDEDKELAEFRKANGYS